MALERFGGFYSYSTFKSSFIPSSMVLKFFVGPWPIFQICDPTQSEQTNLMRTALPILLTSNTSQ